MLGLACKCKLRQRWASRRRGCAWCIVHSEIGAELNSRAKVRPWMPQRKRTPKFQNPLLILPNFHFYINCVSWQSDLLLVSSLRLLRFISTSSAPPGKRRLYPRTFRCCMKEAFGRHISNASYQSPLLAEQNVQAYTRVYVIATLSEISNRGVTQYITH